jgi:hypothetical protein
MSEFEVQSGKHLLPLSSSQFDPTADVGELGARQKPRTMPGLDV